jgi:trigger factor
VEEDRLEGFKEGLMSSSRAYIEETLQRRKVIEMLVENAVFVDAPESKEEVEIVESEEIEEGQEDRE